MSVAPHSVLASAKLIHESQSDEAGRRAVISRSYYAAFNAAREFHSSLPSPGSVVTATGLHEQLAEQLENPTVPKSDERHSWSRKVGVMLRDCHHDRVMADYYFGQNVDESVATKVLLTCTKILELAKVK